MIFSSNSFLKRVFLVFALFALPAPLTAAEFNDTQKEELGKIIRDYLINNPEVLEEAMRALEQRRETARLANQKRAIKAQSALIFSSPRQAVLGNPNGDVTLVEFFDYNCGFCRRAMGDLLTLLENDKNLKVVIKEWPVLGQESVEAARVSIALTNVAPEKYLEFHQKLLTGRGRVNGAKALAVANSVGVDMDKLQAAMKDAEVVATLEEVNGIATGLGLTGTPSYVVGDTVVGGAVGAEELARTVAAARK